MYRKLIALLLVSGICLAGMHIAAFADSAASSQPVETVSCQYNENGNTEVITVETLYPDGSRKTTITILDPVLQLPVSEDTVITSWDGSRETVNVTYTRDESGNLLEKSSVTVERDGSELKDLITNNSYGSNTYRRTECFDKAGNLMMSEETAYVYNAENVLLSAVQSSYQQNGHTIKTVITYDETGENPVESTTDYSYADGSSGTVKTVYGSEESDLPSEKESDQASEAGAVASQEFPSSDPVSLSADSSGEKTQSDTAASDL